MGDEDWTWAFTPAALDQFKSLQGDVQRRIVEKLDEVVDSPWRSPEVYLDSLTGGPFWKLRIGAHRLACTLDHDRTILDVHRIEHRSGAYTADD